MHEQNMSLVVSTVFVQEVLEEVRYSGGCDVPTHKHVSGHTGGVKLAPLCAVVVVNDQLNKSWKGKGKKGNSCNDEDSHEGLSYVCHGKVVPIANGGHGHDGEVGIFQEGDMLLVAEVPPWVSS